MKETIFHPEAWAEISESASFYESRLSGLGLRFLTAVQETIDRISTSPEAGTSLGSEYRRRIVPEFPYGIIYRVWQDYIYLVAVAHHHRRPGYWRGRTDRR